MVNKIRNLGKKYSSLWPFIVFTVLLIFFTRNFISKPGLIFYSEFLESTNFWLLLKDYLKGWGEYSSFGHSNIGLTTSYGLNPVFWILPPGYFTPLLTLLSTIQLFFGHATGKVYILLGISSPFIGMYLFGLYWFGLETKKKIEIQAYSFIAALIYSVSTIMSDRIIAAHLRYSLAHGIFPVLIASTLCALEHSKKERLYILANGLMVGVIIWLMPHLLTLYIFFMGLYFLVVLHKQRFFFPLIRIGFFSISIGFLLNIHIWLPAIFYSEPLTYVEDLQFIMQFVYYLSSIIPYKNSLLLASSYDKAFLSAEVFQHILIGKMILVMLGLTGFVIKKNKKGIFLVLIALLSIIFSIGVKYPFESVYRYLFEHVFLFKPFRDMSKFLILYLFSLSLLIPNIFAFIRSKYKKIFWLSIILFTIYIVAINPAFYSGNFLNSIVPYNLPDKYGKLDTFLAASDDNFRVAVYPNTSTLKDYSWFRDVRINPTFNSVFLSVVPLSKNLAVSNRSMSDYQSRYLDVIESNLDKKWAVERLGNARVKYLIVDLDLPKATEVVADLNRNPGVKKIHGVDGFVTFEILNYCKSDVTKHPAFYYFGDIPGMKFIPSEAALINLGTDENGIGLLRKKYSHTILLYNSTTDDLFFTLLHKFNLSFFPEVRFTKDSFHEFYIAGANLYGITQKGIMFYNKEIIQATGQATISKNFHVDPGKYKLLMSTVTTDNQSNSFTLTINNTVFQKSNFRKKKNSQEWINFGTLNMKDDTVSITIHNNETASLYIDQLILVPIEDYTKLRKEFDALLKDSIVVDVATQPKNLSSDSTTYVLSNAYSPYWDICGTQSIRVNFTANGSFCKDTQNIHPKFIPDTLYRYSLYLSWILSGGAVVILIVLLRRPKS